MSETRDNKLVVFRVDSTVYDRSKTNEEREKRRPVYEWIFSELQQGRLRQGWGHPAFRLLDETGKRVDKSTWTKSYCEHWGNPSRRRFSILSQMLDIRKGDIVVVPKLPKENEFSIARVNGNYCSDDGWGKDFCHIVPVDPAKQFNYHTDDDAFLISGLFSRACHRSPVSFCISERHIDAASSLLDKESNTTAQSKESLIEVWINNSFKEAAKSLQEEVKAWNGSIFQEVVKQAFQNQGYEVKETNRYDRKGGDVDILVSSPRQFSLFSSDIAVQVKWKQGIDRYDENAVEQIVKGVESRGSDAAKYVISSASGFTEKGEEKAEENDVIIILGLQTMAFLLGFPDQYREEWEENE